MKDGIYHNIGFDDYLKIEAINSSTLYKLWSKTPAHAKEYLDAPAVPTPAMAFGSAFHKYTLEPNYFTQSYAIAPKCDRRTKDGKATWEEFTKSAVAKDVISADDYHSIKLMGDACRSHPAAERYLNEGKPEVVLIWTDKNGLKCKARLDYLHEKDGVIIDLKSTASAAENDFVYSLFKYGWFQQGAFYSDGLEHLQNELNSFVFVCVEKEPPFATAVYELGGKTMAAGRMVYRKALNHYKLCLSTGMWPGYSDQPEIVDLPIWALDKCGYREGVTV